MNLWKLFKSFRKDLTAKQAGKVNCFFVLFTLSHIVFIIILLLSFSSNELQKTNKQTNNNNNQNNTQQHKQNKSCPPPLRPPAKSHRVPTIGSSPKLIERLVMQGQSPAHSEMIVNCLQILTNLIQPPRKSNKLLQQLFQRALPLAGGIGNQLSKVTRGGSGSSKSGSVSSVSSEEMQKEAYRREQQLALNELGCLEAVMEIVNSKDVAVAEEALRLCREWWMVGIWRYRR